MLALEPEEMFYRMARLRDFDVAEFSLSTYTVLRGRGEPLVAIPVFPSFAFRHSAIFVRDDAGIREPRDLVGKRVGRAEVPHDGRGVGPRHPGGRVRRRRRATSTGSRAERARR